MADSAESESTTAEQTTSQRRPPPLNRASTAGSIGAKTCWICYSDSTEDDERTSGTWRTPCPCALTAHESCLLDWVADLENPKNRKGTKPDKIQCPQCKSEIKIARPKSYVVDGVKAVDRIISKLTFPGVAFTFAGTLWAGAFYHGFQSIYWVFGTEDAERVLHHAAQHRGAMQIGLPLIPLNLIMARTRYSDFILPATTIFLITNQLYDSFEIDLTIWPPTASTAFACLPLVRNTYTFVYERLFGELERKWMAEVQPRAGQNDNQDAQGNPLDGANQAAANAADDVRDGDVLLELNVDIDMGGGAEDEDQPQEEAAPPPPPIPLANENQNPPNDNENANGQPQAPQGNLNPQAQGAAGPLAANANALVLETSSIATTVLGALLFPSVAAGMGELLKLTLPPSWTVPPMTQRPAISPFSSETLSHIWSVVTGRVGEKTASGLTRLPLLQTRWGRTVIGGCIFVVVKDMIMLYWRWRIAKSHRQRRVMDWDRSRGTWRLPG